MRRILVCFLGGVFLLVLGAGLYGRWRQGGVNWELMTRELASLDGGWVAGAAGLAIGSYVVRALRWGVMLAAVKKQGRRFENLLAATAIGSTAVLLLGRIGELVRPYLIARKEGVPVSSQMGVWVVERVYDLLTALILLGYALGQGPVFGGVLTDGLRAGGWALAIGAGAGVAAMAGLAIWPDWAER
ncbi:MAG: flippase-like domain-containing protein, partial [Bryobacteraceae bacterium]|nr:flippase-like domain-containing protein [Bryobacteraceae bacterium]